MSKASATPCSPTRTPSARGADRRRLRTGRRRACAQARRQGVMPSAARRTRPAPVIDIVIESPFWREQPDAEAVIRRALATAAEMTEATGPRELAILLCD